MNKINVTFNGKPIHAGPGLSVSEIINGEKPCGGHGKCGKCKVIINGNVSDPSEAELRLLRKDELDRDVRLACLTRVLGDCKIESLSEPMNLQIATDGVVPDFELSPVFLNYGIAIDIGTTTMAARLYDVKGTMISEASRLNPQAKWGADVISRIESALCGKASQLAKSIRTALNGIILELATMISAADVDYVVITGNTVMLSLLTEQSVEPFSHAPFAVKRLFGQTLTAEQLSLSVLLPDTPVYLPPCISAFVGADITCALLATDLYKNDTAMLADIGTNGELALWHHGKLTVCATAAGPAFEGVGISMGMRGLAGAVDKVVLENGGLKAHVIGEIEPKGICGSGIIDAAACMLELGTIDESGYLEKEEYIIHDPVRITPKDIRMLQLAKSAICAGMLTLMDNQRVNPKEISALYIAGGFGSYLNKRSAVKIGLLPLKLTEVSSTVGNAALSGAAMLLLNSRIKDTAAILAQNAEILDLSVNPVFAEYYVAGMLFGQI